MRRSGWLVLLLGLAGEPVLAGDSLHTLAFMEGRYTGNVQVERPDGWASPPVLRYVPIALSVEPRGGGLVIRWLLGQDGYAAAIVGTIGPTTYAAPERFEDGDWECRPASIPPFRPEPHEIVVRLLCFVPGELHRPPLARLEVGNTLDRLSRRVTGRLIFDLRELGAREDRQETLRRSHGFLIRRLD